MQRIGQKALRNGLTIDHRGITGDKSMPKAKHSPCIKVCEYDEQGYCLGCQRTEEEVRGWRDRTEQQQLDGIEMLRGRRIERE